MSEPTPSRPAPDRNLLFGILALQMDFIGRAALVAAMNAWVLDKHKPLGQVLVERDNSAAAAAGKTYRREKLRAAAVGCSDWILFMASLGWAGACPKCGKGS
jgi:hypothetical protein